MMDDKNDKCRRYHKEKYLNKSETDLVIQQIGSDNSREREDINLEMNRRLVKAIKDFNKKSSRQTWWIIALTIILGIIAFIQLILLFI